MSWSSFCRQVKNKTLYTSVQTKVRNATSNEVAFPSVEDLNTIASMTYYPDTCAQVMNILWKRLHDKSWRHVLKSLNLLEHLLKNGHVKIAEKCRENTVSISELKRYQCVEGNSDCGAFVRGQVEAILKLLHEPDMLENERKVSMSEHAKGTPMKTYPFTSTPTFTMSQNQKAAKEQVSFYVGINEGKAAGLKSELPNPEQLEKDMSSIINANPTKQDEILIDENQYNFYL